MAVFRTNPPDACAPYPCQQCMVEGGSAGGPLLTAGKGTNTELVHWCAEHFPHAGGNATYFCKDVGMGVELALTAAQEAQCTTTAPPP